MRHGKTRALWKGYVKMNKNIAGGIGCLLAIVLFIGGCTAFVNVKLNSFITDEKALSDFRRLAGTQDVVITKKSNDSMIFGNPQDVLYELTINGKPSSGRCVSGDLSTMICRIYGAGQSE